MAKTIIKNSSVFTENGFKQCDVLIEDGKISRLSKEIKSESGNEIIEAEGMWLLPSFVDLHVHLREPGFSYKETIKTGTLAAAAGGFTKVCPMPNLNPAPDSLSNLQIQLDIIKKDACIGVLPFATITKGRQGKELVDYEAIAPYVAGFSDDGSGVQSEDVMKRAMEGIAKTGKILAAHCEVNSLLKGGYIHDGEYASLHNHKGICSESEWKEVERDIRLSKETGCRLHICHISTKESVQLVREAKKDGIPVTCETGPHYLTFSENDIQEHGRFKMNPPIRSIEDREALRQGIIDGTIDVIATDHAPHSLLEKSKGLEKSAMGVVGLETVFSAVYTTMVKSGLISIERLIELMAINPRKILGIQQIPYINEGMTADIVGINHSTKWVVNPNDFFTAGRSTPYEGMTLDGKVAFTFLNGKRVYPIDQIY